MPSGAGHDALEMAKIAPAGMIFVPSGGDQSFSPRVDSDQRYGQRDQCAAADDS